MRPSAARRRFHTDRIVRNRRAAWWREGRRWLDPVADAEWAARRLTYGRLASTDPHDCGNPRCGVCHGEKNQPGQRRAREKRTWRRDIDVDSFGG